MPYVLTSNSNQLSATNVDTIYIFQEFSGIFKRHAIHQRDKVIFEKK